ncbi:MAG: hypothetical protein R6V12_17295 [Candidatus Hydrogenedentota bacterium]
MGFGSTVYVYYGPSVRFLEAPFSWAFSPGWHVTAPLALQTGRQPCMPEQYRFQRHRHWGCSLDVCDDFGRDRALLQKVSAVHHSVRDIIKTEFAF